MNRRLGTNCVRIFTVSLLGALAAACAVPPLVQDRIFELDHGAFERISVVPFQPGPKLSSRDAVPPPPPNALDTPDGLGGPGAPGGPGVLGTADAPELDPALQISESDATTLTTRFVTEAFAAAGYEMIPASDLAHAFEAAGLEMPRGDVVALARIAAQDFGAKSVMLGRVDRYRERDGGEFGAFRPASVSFEITLYAAPSGRKLWTARFDHTQHPVTDEPLRAPQYPGAGSRWLSVGELTRWGAKLMAERLAEPR